jgi:hypothetical protein
MDDKGDGKGKGQEKLKMRSNSGRWNAMVASFLFGNTWTQWIIVLSAFLFYLGLNFVEHHHSGFSDFQHEYGFPFAVYGYDNSGKSIFAPEVVLLNLSIFAFATLGFYYYWKGRREQFRRRKRSKV